MPMFCEVRLWVNVCAFTRSSPIRIMSANTSRLWDAYLRMNNIVEGRGKLVSTVTQSFPFHSFRDADTTANILILLVAFLQQSFKPTASFLERKAEWSEIPMTINLFLESNFHKADNDFLSFPVYLEKNTCSVLEDSVHLVILIGFSCLESFEKKKKCRDEHFLQCEPLARPLKERCSSTAGSCTTDLHCALRITL